MKERYRRIPIELTLAPAFEGFASDAKLTMLILLVSPRQTPPGVFEGTRRALEYETGLSAERQDAALGELEAAGGVVSLSGGGWWVCDAFRWQACNSSYSVAAVRMLEEKWPDLLERFMSRHRATLEKFPAGTKQTKTTDPPPCGTDPPPCAKGSEEVAVPGTEADAALKAADASAHEKIEEEVRRCDDFAGAPLGGAPARVQRLQEVPVPTAQAASTAEPPIPGPIAAFVSGFSAFKQVALVNLFKRIASGGTTIEQAQREIETVEYLTKPQTLEFIRVIEEALACQ